MLSANGTKSQSLTYACAADSGIAVRIGAAAGISSTRPRVFISIPSAAESLHVNPTRRAAASVPHEIIEPPVQFTRDTAAMRNDGAEQEGAEECSSGEDFR